MLDLTQFADFTDIPVLSKEELEKGKQTTELIRKAEKTYTDESSLDTFFSGAAFNEEEERKKIIDDLNKLNEISVEEFTFLKKYEEVHNLFEEKNTYYLSADDQFKARIWAPTDINNEELTIQEISDLKPKMVVVNDDLEKMWSVLRIYCSSAEFNQAPGRFIKFLLMDENTDKVLGISSIASDVISITARDKHIGWTSDNKLKDKKLRYSAIGTTIVATQPFGSNFLGGKLQAAMMTTDVVRNAWEHQEKGESERCKLVGMTTTSLYGRPSMYNSLKWWKDVGDSMGKIPIKPDEKIYKKWHDWLKRYHKDAYDKMMTQKEGVSGPVTGAKMRVLSMMFSNLKLKQSDYCHGFQRGVYYSCFYENTKEFLCGKISEAELVMKPLFKDDVKAVIDWWKPKAIERYKKLKLENKLNPEKLFYNSMNTLTYQEAKDRMFNQVGK